MGKVVNLKTFIQLNSLFCRLITILDEESAQRLLRAEGLFRAIAEGKVEVDWKAQVSTPVVIDTPVVRK